MNESIHLDNSMDNPIHMNNSIYMNNSINMNNSIMFI